MPVMMPFCGLPPSYGFYTLGFWKLITTVDLLTAGERWFRNRRKTHLKMGSRFEPIGRKLSGRRNDFLTCRHVGPGRGGPRRRGRKGKRPVRTHRPFERRGGDSNPRYQLTRYNFLAGSRFRPLSHLSKRGEFHRTTLAQRDQVRRPPRIASRGVGVPPGASRNVDPPVRRHESRLSAGARRCLARGGDLE